MIQEFPQPQTHRELRQLLGLVSFYHRFVSGCASILQPLHDLLSSPPKKDRPLAWTPEAISAFTHIKDALAEASLLCHPQLDAPTWMLPTSLWELCCNSRSTRSVVPNFIFLAKVASSREAV